MRRPRLRTIAWILLLAAVPFVSPVPHDLPSIETFIDDPPAPSEDAADDAPIRAVVVPAPTEQSGALDGFVTVSGARFRVRARPELREYAESVAGDAERHFDDLQRLLGPAEGPTIEFRLVAGADEMAAVAPPGRRPPTWASGVTYADQDLILIALVSPHSGRFVPLGALVRHELAHLVVARIVGDHPIPRWFDEGIALWAAADDYAGRTATLLDAAVGDRLIPLERLEQGYPRDPGLVPLAYAQSLDVVAYIADTHGRSAVPRLLAALGRGTPFRQAVLETLGTTVARLEQDWRSNINIWYRWVPAIVSGTLLWGLVAFLLAWAYLRQRRRRREIYAEWDREEARAEAAEAAQITRIPTAAGPTEDAYPPVLPPGTWPDPNPKPWGGIRPGRSETRGEQVTFRDGGFHTLH